MIREFGAPNGLCSSITESKHIKAVKEPWRRSNHYEALGQMLVTNQRLDKLAAARVDFKSRGMLAAPLFGPNLRLQQVPRASELVSSLAPTVNDDDDGGETDDLSVDGEVFLCQKYITGLPPKVEMLAAHFNIPSLPHLVATFVHKQQEHARRLSRHGIEDQESDSSTDSDSEVPDSLLPRITGNVRIFPSAIAVYYAPSDRSGVRGLLRERIRAVDRWRGGPARYDTVYVIQDPVADGFKGLLVARVRLFMSVKHDKVVYPCALVAWYSAVGDQPCPDTGMWVVKPDLDADGDLVMEVIHLETIFRSAHLMGKAGESFVPHNLKFYNSLDAFDEYYVNKYIDHHAHEIAF
ncbi:hypothetical protein CPC08DRAFT_728207 [Agrocybe pediades]|nr:hypothetical protein CPC08DRAFT_728207 [Agrocybe pediades]